MAEGLSFIEMRNKARKSLIALGGDAIRELLQRAIKYRRRPLRLGGADSIEQLKITDPFFITAGGFMLHDFIPATDLCEFIEILETNRKAAFYYVNNPDKILGVVRLSENKETSNRYDYLLSIADEGIGMTVFDAIVNVSEMRFHVEPADALDLRLRSFIGDSYD